MEHIAPLVQTVLWVGLLAVILWRFHEPIHGLLVAVQRRVEGGSNIKAGPFELTEQLKPQDLPKQKEKAALELAEALEGQPDVEQPAVQPPVGPHAATLQARYFQAEDLVLRAIQAEYGATVSRQVTAGADMGFDGAFVSNGRLNIVEVKYLSNARNLARLRVSVDHITNVISRYGWRNVQVILAVVLEDAGEVAKMSERMQELVSQSSIPVVVRGYSFAELRQKFGVVVAQGG